MGSIIASGLPVSLLIGLGGLIAKKPRFASEYRSKRVDVARAGHKGTAPFNVGIVGLGAGAMACNALLQCPIRVEKVDEFQRRRLVGRGPVPNFVRCIDDHDGSP